MERGVITEIPLYVLKMFSGLSSISSRLIGVTSHTTPLSIRRGVGGEARPVGVTSHTTPLSIRRGAGGEAGRGWGRGQPVRYPSYKPVTHKKKYQTREGLVLLILNLWFKCANYLPPSIFFFKSARTPRSPRDVPAATLLIAAASPFGLPGAAGRWRRGSSFTSSKVRE